MNVVDAKSAVQGMVDTLFRESRGKRQRLAKIPGWRSLPFFVENVYESSRRQPNILTMYHSSVTINIEYSYERKRWFYGTADNT